MKKLPIILIVLSITIPAAFAQQQGSDNSPRTAHPKDTVSTGFDATRQMFQKRYQHPDAVPFDTLWKNNVYISLFGGMDKMIPRGNTDFNTGPAGGIAASWQFAPAHALRASLLAGNFSRKIDNETLMRFGLQADYLLNVSSYVNGYNPGRIFEFLTVAGVGYQLSSLAGRTEHVADLHLGFQLKLHPTAHVDFYLEPRFTIMSDGIDHSFQKNWHKYDMTYGATVGMNYRLKAWKPFGKIRILEGNRFLDNTFVSVAAGGQLQASRLTSEIGLVNSVGPHISLSAGKWLIPAFGLRLSGFKSSDTWHKKVTASSASSAGEEFYEMSAYAGGRLEGMLDATYFFNGRQVNPKFSVNVLAGGELGYILKENGYRPAKGGYTGFTGGVQLKYRLFGDVSLFVEPRTSLASYSLKTSEKEEGRYVAKKFTDNLYSINVGIEIRRADEENRMAHSLNRELFRPSFFVSGAIGFSTPIQMKRYELKRYFGYQAMINAGRIFTPLSSLRLGADYTPLSTDLKGETVKYDMASGSLDYMLNLTNLMTGYDPERKYDIQLFAGVVASVRMQHESRFFIGGEAGLHTSYRVSRRFKVFLEPKIRIYGKELLMQDNVQGSDIMMSLNAGTSFSF